jgi:hypothetical protein
MGVRQLPRPGFYIGFAILQILNSDRDSNKSIGVVKPSNSIEAFNEETGHGLVAQAFHFQNAQEQLSCQLT